MSFTDVYEQECGFVPVLPVQGAQGGCLGSEGGSGVAREDQDHRLFLAERRELHQLQLRLIIGFCFEEGIEPRQLEVGRHLAGLDRIGTAFSVATGSPTSLRCARRDEQRDQ
jgi:hypothetical protein